MTTTTEALRPFDELLQAAEQAERYLAKTPLPVASDVYAALSHACDRGRAHIAEALAKPQAAIAWQPIATAPRDGTSILLWEQSSVDPFVGVWSRQNRWAVITEHVDTDGDACVVSKLWQEGITHWMPLQAPPKP